MVNPVELNNPNNTMQSGSTNTPDENLKAALFSINPQEATQEQSSNTPMSTNTTETMPTKTHDINTEDESTLQAIIDNGPAYEYINNLGNGGKLDKLVFDINGNLTSSDNVTHAITGKPLGAYVIEGDPPPPPPAVAANLSSTGSGDPHFVGLHGNHFEFQGIPGHIFNLLSDARIQVNALFNQSNPGTTVMGQIGLLIGKDQDRLLVSPGGSVNLDGSHLGNGQTAKLKEGTVSVSGGNASISTKEYGINIINRGDYLDIGIGTTSEGVYRDEVMPSGVIGQTASGNHNLSADDFMVHDGIFGTNFASNKFGAKTKIDKMIDKIKEKYELT